MSETRDLLLEIGVEELPASFVDGALAALPGLVAARLAELRLAHGMVRALGTPRRLAVIVERLADRQPDLEEEVTGPPAAIAFDESGTLTRAGEAFAKKLGLAPSALERKETPKGAYLVGVRREAGRPTIDLLGAALAQACAAVPFRKSMRWGELEQPFGRPVRWLVALFGPDVVPFAFAGCTSGRITYGHRFLAPAPIEIGMPSAYEAQLAVGHVIAAPDHRRTVMLEGLAAGAKLAEGELIEDAFLVGENVSLVEEPHIIVGHFEERFLELPEEVILAVARGHQRYFGVRTPGGGLRPRYLAVAGTALDPETIRRGNDRVMRARLADAQFFFNEDKKVGLSGRRASLEGIVFHNRLGSVGAKVERLEKLVSRLAAEIHLQSGDAAWHPDGTVAGVARRGAELAKNDLASLMVGEFPELQGAMGRAYALAQGESREVADVVRDHYLPKGAADAPARSPAAALVALADRLDTLVGCFAINLAPTGAADPYGLRRACLTFLRIALAHDLDVGLARATNVAYRTYIEQNVKLDLDESACEAKLAAFFHDRLRTVLEADLPADVVEACLAANSDRPFDVRARARALAALDAGVRAKVGEVFKRVANIAKDAPAGNDAPVPPSDVEAAPHASELALYEAYRALTTTLASATEAGDYARAFGAIASLAPLLHVFFENVFVMVDDPRVRDNRLRLLRALRDRCAAVAHVQLLQHASAAA